MKLIYKKKISKINRNQDINLTDIINSKKILFSVFTRYGDGIISFQIIKEFIKKYPEKFYTIITPVQQVPYIKEILRDYKNIRIISYNKKNPFNLYQITTFLKKENFDLGFNPWSFGEDSKYFISFAKKQKFYKDFSDYQKYTKIDNLYDRIREYLFLPINKKKQIINFDISNLKKKTIILAPFSTDITKNLSIKNIDTIIKKFNRSNIILALPKDKSNYKFNVKKFIFYKNKQNSEKFLQLMKESDIFIGVDSGPLHLAIALNKPSIAIFGPTAPQTILNNNQKIKIIRNTKLQNIFCFVRECKNPICIHNIITEDFLNINYSLDYQLKLETKKCPLKMEK